MSQGLYLKHFAYPQSSRRFSTVQTAMQHTYVYGNSLSRSGVNFRETPNSGTWNQQNIQIGNSKLLKQGGCLTHHELDALVARRPVLISKTVSELSIGLMN